MLAFEVARKDLIQILRDRRALIFMLLMPLAFTLIFSVSMGGGAKPEADPRLPVGVIDQDGGSLLSQSLLDLLSASATVRPVPIEDPANADEQVRGGNLAAAILLPAGYTRAVLDGATPTLEIVIEEASEAGQTARRAIQASLTRLSGSAAMARFGADEFAIQSGEPSSAAREAYLRGAVQKSTAEWAKSRVAVVLTGPQVQPGEAPEENPNNQFSPGMMVMFAVFGLTQTAMVLVTERRGGALQRLMASPIRRWELIGGHILGAFIVVFIQQLLLALFGEFALKVHYFREPLATVLVMAALSLWISTMGLLIATLAKGEEQATLYSMICMFILSAFGGAWFPLEMVGKTFSAIGHLTPTAWAMDGFQNVLMRGLGVHSVVLPVAILLGYALLCFGVSVWKFKFE